MFQCHKCGYKDLSDNEKTSCPICGTNIIVPKFALVLFLSLICFILFTFLSLFSKKLGIISNISIIVAIISLPLAIIEAIGRKNEIQDGFRAPDYPSEIINRNPRVPNFESFGYVAGLQNDNGVKKIMIETYKDGLNLYHNKLQEMITVNYSDIVGIELHSDIDIKQSNAKSLIYGITLYALGGLGAGIVGATLGGVKAEDVYYLELQIKENEDIYSLYLTDSKSRLLTLAQNIEDKVNSK